jgi:hypothetical protein
VSTPGAPLVVDALLRAAQDHDPNVRLVAMHELAQQARAAGPKHRAIVEAVMAAVKDPLAAVKTGAVQALAAILISQVTARPRESIL